jgi:hypothetical protein
MSKKLIWILIAVVLVITVGAVAYIWGTKSSPQTDASQVGKAISDYLNMSQARSAESCGSWTSSGNYSILDVGGKYKGVINQQGNISGVCF